MQEYTVRDDKGRMIARLAGVAAERVLDSVPGYWRTYKTKDVSRYQGSVKRTVCYEVTEDSKWGIDNRYGGVQLYLWKGTIIIKD